LTGQKEKAPRVRRAKPGSRVVAVRYARALLEVVLDKKADLDAVANELESFVSLLSREPALEAALTAPTIPAARRVGILEAVLASAKVSTETRNLLRLLAKNERVALASIVAESYRILVLEHRQIQPAEVVSAHALSSDQKNRLAGQLGIALGKTMELSYRTDPELLGGVVVRVANRVFDASVKSQLRRFKENALSRL
jgi:F-type H+-transporting ATPase subunit delta